MTTEQTAFESKVKSNLDKSLLTLDAETNEALASIRLKALEHQLPKSRLSLNDFISNKLVSNTWIPAGAFALCALLTTLIIVSPNHMSDSAPIISAQSNTDRAGHEQINMLDLLTQAEDIETATDPDFYVWTEEVLATEDIDNAV